MTRLILTADSSSAGGLQQAGRADVVIAVAPRLVWGPLPSDDKFNALLAPRTTQKPGDHWLDFASASAVKKIGGRDPALIELCARHETVELWMESDPNDQLVLIWLLDHFHTHPTSTINLILRHIDASLRDAGPKRLAKWKFAAVGITKDHLEIASQAWQAYRAPTPQAWFSLLKTDLSILPQLRRTVLELLNELPGRTTGLASELRILELISAGYAHPFDVFPHYRDRFQHRLGSGRPAGGTCACADTGRVRTRRVAVHAGNARLAPSP